VDNVKPADVRAAREFLRKRGVRGVSPRQFARSAMEAGVSYQTLLGKLAGVARRKLDASDDKTVR
jgi:hypothetical protein